ncbi:MAG TPA: helix-turn-helix domain-containing protein [Conexibacter sp.]|nr:helix-turn-helix domain-containing protein [Conexibacter sp.]
MTSLVRVAVHSDDSAQLIAAAGLLLRLPLALVGPHGESLGYAPEGSEGRRALAVARAAALNRLVSAVGWSIVPIRRGSSLGFLAIGARQAGDAETQALLETLPELVAEQLHRVELLRAHREAFVRRLVSDPRFDPGEARHEAGELGLQLADAYWPAILAWHATAPPLPVVERLARDALSHVQGSLAALLRRRIVLLHPVRGTDADPVETGAWLAQVVTQARTLAPSFPAQAIVGETAVELGGVSTQVAELDALRRLGPRSESSGAVVPARAYALERLFWDNLDVVAARRFVDEQLERLTTWDRERRTDLLSVLEAALDFPRHDQAASRCFMHRNTFRHRLQQAGEVLGTTLEDPDERLGVHVALKLHRLLAASTPDHGTAAARAVRAASDRRSEPRSADSVGVLMPRPSRRRV